MLFEDLLSLLPRENVGNGKLECNCNCNEVIINTSSLGCKSVIKLTL